MSIQLSRLRPYALLGVLILCAAVRIGALIAFPSVFAFNQTGAVQGSDAYDIYARNLLTTGVYGYTPGVPDATIPPLYSYALALVYAVFGRGYWQVGLFHTALDMLSIVLLYQIGKRLMPNPARANSEDATVRRGLKPAGYRPDLVSSTQSVGLLAGV